jgi:hypothetical protein
MSLVAALWGVVGVAMLLAYAIYRLSSRVLEALNVPLDWYHWLALLLWVGIMAYSEGYRGFQKAFSPRVAARARYLHAHVDNKIYWLLSPFFVASYLHTTPRRRLSAVLLTSGIVLLVMLVGRLSQPWRGIIDAGVVVGLTWGLISLVLLTYQALTAEEFDVSPDLPEPKKPKALPSPPKTDS